jgi:hypothetical protein
MNDKIVMTRRGGIRLPHPPWNAGCRIPVPQRLVASVAVRFHCWLPAVTVDEH